MATHINKHEVGIPSIGSNTSRNLLAKGADSTYRIGGICTTRIRCWNTKDDLIQEMVDQIHLSCGVPAGSVDIAVKGSVRNIEGGLPDVREFYTSISHESEVLCKYLVQSMMEGTVVKSAWDAMNDTSLVPLSMSVPSVGQAVAGREADGGEYEIVSTPAVLYASANCVTGKLSELTISIVTTADCRLAAPLMANRTLGLLTIVRIRVHPALDWSYIRVQDQVWSR